MHHGLWALLKGQPTPVPGIIIADPASVLKVTVTTAASRQAEGICGQAHEPSGLQRRSSAAHRTQGQGRAGLHSGQRRKADTDAMGDVLTETPAHIRKIAIEPAVAVDQCGRDAGRQGRSRRGLHRQHEGPALLQRCSGIGPALGFQPATELDGTYDTYTQVRGSGLDGCVSANRATRWIPPAGEEDSAGASPAQSLRPRITRSNWTCSPVSDRRTRAAQHNVSGIIKGSPLRRSALFFVLI